MKIKFFSAAACALTAFHAFMDMLSAYQEAQWGFFIFFAIACCGWASLVLDIIRARIVEAT